MIGLIKSIDRYDPERGVPFAGFAVPTITGEIRRHFRDLTWALKVPRAPKDLQVGLRAAEVDLIGKLGRAPTVAEVATALGTNSARVLQARAAWTAYSTTSTDSLSEELAAGVALPDPRPTDQVLVEDRVLLTALLEAIAPRERVIVYLRYFEGLTQVEIGRKVGLSQVQVSRLLVRSLRAMRVGAPVEHRC